MPMKIYVDATICVGEDGEPKLTEDALGTYVEIQHPLRASTVLPRLKGVKRVVLEMILRDTDLQPGEYAHDGVTITIEAVEGRARFDLLPAEDPYYHVSAVGKVPAKVAQVVKQAIYGELVPHRKLPKPAPPDRENLGRGGIVIKANDLDLTAWDNPQWSSKKYNDDPDKLTIATVLIPSYSANGGFFERELYLRGKPRKDKQPE